MTRRKLAAGNWKMNGLVTSLVELDALMAGVGEPDCDVLICPPATLIAGFAGVAQTSVIRIGGQDCHVANKGAHTGDVSAEMLADAGAEQVLAIAFVDEIRYQASGYLVGVINPVPAREACLPERLVGDEGQLGTVKVRLIRLILVLAVQVVEPGFQGLQ